MPVFSRLTRQTRPIVLKQILSPMITRHLLLLLFLQTALIPVGYPQDYCIRFLGNGVNDIDRIKIPIDNPHRKADVGYDFTIEFQLKALLADNPLGGYASQGANDDWTLGHIIADRDIFGGGDYGDYGISLAGGRIAFGVNNGSDSYTLIGNTIVADGNWHHIAVTRNSTSGAMRIFVDGSSDKYVASTAVTGNVSYRDGRPITNNQWVNEPFIVLGAEKHDYDNTTYPSLSGFLDEFRISDAVRYTASYTPASAFSDDVNTVLLFHFDEGAGMVALDAALISPGVPASGSLQYGGVPAGPLWVFRGAAWTGSVSSEWDNPANWSPVALPLPGDDVLLPASLFQPSVHPGMTLPAACDDLYLLPGAILTVSPGKILQVNGNLNIRGD